MAFIRKASPPPAIEIGQTLKATIKAYQYPVKSPPNNVYPQRDQIQFSLELDDGYRFKTWISYYEEPHEHSNLGILCTTLMTTTGQKHDSLDDALNALRNFGSVFVVCTGQRESRGTTYPKLKIVCERLPDRPTTPQQKPKLTPQKAEEMRRQLTEAGYSS